MRGIAGKVTLITGGIRGIGKGIARRFVEEGAQVIVTGSKDVENARKTVEELSKLGKIESYMADLSDAGAIDKMIDDVVKKYGRIDILINNAGIQIREWATEFKVEDFDKVLGVNLRAYYLAARYMKKQGGGSIVCISSGNSERYTTRRSAYNISKAAVNGLVGTLGVEWGRFNIRINGVAPGYVMTDMVQKGIDEGIIDVDNIMLVIPMKRFLQPEEIASSVCFLASDEASGITGQVLFTDGGWSRAGLPEQRDI